MVDKCGRGSLSRTLHAFPTGVLVFGIPHPIANSTCTKATAFRPATSRFVTADCNRKLIRDC
jgi:hypothetical protein